MTRSSPSVERVVAVLDFFTDHPGQAFNLTDLIRSLKLSRATCHALLTSLVEAKYLYRTSDKAYVLGPRLAAVGRAAALSFSPLQVAKPELRRLADAYDVVCSAVFREGHDVVVRERAASVSTLGSSISAGTRLPLRPPFGGIFLAWSSEAEIAEWLDTLAPPATADLRAQMHRGIAFARENGFQCVVRTGHETGGDKSTDWLFFNRPDEHPVSVLGSLDPAAAYPLAAVTAPVFDERREVAFALTLAGFTGTRRGAEVIEAGAALQAVCARISAFIAGKV